ncbi:MAG: hypothetical protein LBJ74_01285 [Heliobacteriaceae bacterium]|jgi:hypothetical protein|nr:hypothetical protein [Heliobacteriaceae bacterium]
METTKLVLNNKMQQRQISIQLAVVFGGGAVGLAFTPITLISGLLVAAGFYFAFVWFRSFAELEREIETIIKISERKNKC